jgi:hypothetical protein
LRRDFCCRRYRESGQLAKVRLVGGEEVRHFVLQRGKRLIGRIKVWAVRNYDATRQVIMVSLQDTSSDHYRFPIQM